MSFEAADRLAPALSLRLLALEIRARLRVVAALCDRDPVERAVELAVTAAIEAVALDAA